MLPDGDMLVVEIAQGLCPRIDSKGRTSIIATPAAGPMVPPSGRTAISISATAADFPGTEAAAGWFPPGRRRITAAAGSSGSIYTRARSRRFTRSATAIR